MKLIYLSAKTYPATTADHIFVREMARAFTALLGNQFRLVVANDFSQELVGINVINLKLKIKRGLSLFFFFWVPCAVIKHGSNTVFFSVDPNILSILVFYKKVFRFKYKVVSDWHMLFGDWRDGFIAKNSDGLVATTDHLKAIIVGHLGVSDERVLIARGGVELSRFEVEVKAEATEPLNMSRIRLGLPVGAFLVGYAGFYKTMGMSKGLDTMIAALALIKDGDVEAAFVGGKSAEITEYKKLAEEKGVTDRVTFVPVVPTSEIASYEKAMDVLVIPYPDEPHFREYGFPMKVYEYMAAKKPIVYSDLPIIAEVLDGYGVAFKPGDARDLADKILALKNDPSRGKALAEKAYAKVSDFTWQKRTEKIVTFARGL